MMLKVKLVNKLSIDSIFVFQYLFYERHFNVCAVDVKFKNNKVIFIEFL
jgi:hypothetical protein